KPFQEKSTPCRFPSQVSRTCSSREQGIDSGVKIAPLRHRKAAKLEFIMATRTATRPIQVLRSGDELLLPAFTLWLREVVRFYRQRARVVGVIASPIVFWLVIGSGFGHSFRSGTSGDKHYLEFFYP